MSASIDGKKITLTRGDSLLLTVTIMNGDEPYTPQAGDAVRFAMKQSYADAVPLIVKKIPTDTITLELKPEDTKALAYGKYVYDMKITFADGRVDTFIDRGKLTLMQEVD